MWLGNGWNGWTKKHLWLCLVGLMTVCGCDIIVDPPEPGEYVLEVDVDGHGNVLVSPDQGKFEYDSVVQLEAIPDDGWYFDRWDGDVESDNPKITIHMDDDMEVTAKFKEIPDDEVYLRVIAFGCGEVEIHPLGIPRNNGYLYDRDSTVTLDAWPDRDNIFRGWYLDDGTKLSSNETLDIVLGDDETTILAKFEEINPSPPIDLAGAEVWSQDDEFLGYVIQDPFDYESLSDPYGRYGDEYRDMSVWNLYGRYGSYVSEYSAYNRYADFPPKLFLYGDFVGYLTANTDFAPRYHPDEVAQALGRYDVIRD
jgi:hypothetical protein